MPGEAGCAVRKQLQPNLALHAMRAGHCGECDALVGHWTGLGLLSLLCALGGSVFGRTLGWLLSRNAFCLGSRLFRSLGALSRSVFSSAFDRLSSSFGFRSSFFSSRCFGFFSDRSFGGGLFSHN